MNSNCKKLEKKKTDDRKSVWKRNRTKRDMRMRREQCRVRDYNRRNHQNEQNSITVSGKIRMAGRRIDNTTVERRTPDDTEQFGVGQSEICVFFFYSHSDNMDRRKLKIDRDMSSERRRQDTRALATLANTICFRGRLRIIRAYCRIENNITKRVFAQSYGRPVSYEKSEHVFETGVTVTKI